jgi:hypothetical protein
MTEADHSLEETLQQEPKIFDLSDPKTRLEVLKRIETEPLSPGDKIIGMKTWADVSSIMPYLVRNIAAAAETDPAIQPNFKNIPDIEDVIRRRDKERGFWGTSKDFEITMLETDISFMRRTKRLRPTDPTLARTFMLSRTILYGQVVTANCTISLNDMGVTSKPNFYKDGEKKTRHFSGLICVEDREGKALDAIDRSRRSGASFGTGSHGRNTAGIKNLDKL